MPRYHQLVPERCAPIPTNSGGPVCQPSGHSGTSRGCAQRGVGADRSARPSPAFESVSRALTLRIIGCSCANRGVNPGGTAEGYVHEPVGIARLHHHHARFPADVRASIGAVMRIWSRLRGRGRRRPPGALHRRSRPLGHDAAPANARRPSRDGDSPETHFIPKVIKACDGAEDPHDAVFELLTTHRRWPDYGLDANELPRATRPHRSAERRRRAARLLRPLRREAGQAPVG